MRHHTRLIESDICGLIDTPDHRAVCSCGWKTDWDNGWSFVTRLRLWWHERRAGDVIRNP